MLAGAEIRPKLPFQRLRSTADAVHRMIRQGTSQSATNTGPVRRPRDTVMRLARGAEVATEPMEIVPGPGAGRVYEQAIRPGIADATPSGRCRLDAIARWLQDIAYADLVDAGFEGRGAWIVRPDRRRRPFPASARSSS